MKKYYDMVEKHKDLILQAENIFGLTLNLDTKKLRQTHM